MFSIKRNVARTQGMNCWGYIHIYSVALYIGKRKRQPYALWSLSILVCNGGPKFQFRKYPPANYYTDDKIIWKKLF